jgi:hypothetical protein
LPLISPVWTAPFALSNAVLAKRVYRIGIMFVLTIAWGADAP